MNRTVKRGAVLLLFLLLFCALCASAGRANRQGEEDHPLDGVKKSRRTSWLVSPVLYYLPETRLAFGVVGNFVFRMGGVEKRDSTRPSTIAPVFIYTQNKQFRSLLTADIYFKDGDYHLITDIRFLKYPDKFFGIGSWAPTDWEENYTSNTVALSLSLLKRIGKYLNIGVRYNFSKSKIIEYEAGKLLAQGDIPGSRGARLSGLSLLANMDSRDNIFFPRQGEWLRFAARFFHRFIGSQFEFETYRLDLRKYIPLFSSHVLAAQWILQSQRGSVPFEELSKMGGEDNMRGYFLGRYRDKSLWVLQAEYRLPLFWRLAAVGFAGVGDVAGRLGDFKLESTKFSCGFGLRYLFNKREKMYLRFDVGFGKDSSYFYFSVFEAF